MQLWQWLASIKARNQAPAGRFQAEAVEGITVVLSSFARLSNIELIVSTYLDYLEVDELIVWHNGPTPLPPLGQHPKLRTIVSDDLGLSTRFAAALLARHEQIFLHDDDLLVPPQTFRLLSKYYRQDPTRTYAIEGKNPRANNTYGQPVRVLPGWTCPCEIHLNRLLCTSRSLIPHFFELWRATELSLDPMFGGGEDIVYSYAVTAQTSKRPLLVGVPFQNLPKSEAISDRLGNQHANRTKIMHICQKTCSKASVSKASVSGNSK